MKWKIVTEKQLYKKYISGYREGMISILEDFEKYESMTPETRKRVVNVIKSIQLQDNGISDIDRTPIIRKHKE